MAKDDTTDEPKASAPEPLTPSADGPNVSRNGGLVFVGVIVALVALACVLQVVMGG